jgi:hypothetical protein
MIYPFTGNSHKQLPDSNTTHIKFKWDDRIRRNLFFYLYVHYDYINLENVIFIKLS